LNAPQPGKDTDRRRRLRLPSPALVLAALALLVALGGTSYAAVALPNNSVGAAQIRAGAVASPEVRNGSLRTLDLAPAARRALKGQAGQQGRQGPKGDAGPPGLSGVEIVQASSAFVSSPEQTVTVDCPAGKRLVGGGAGVWGRAMIWIPRGVALAVSQPIDEDTWLAKGQEIVETEESWFVQVRAVCAATS
jgi:hypothetical protein